MYHQVYHSGAKKGKVEENGTGMTDLYWYSTRFFKLYVRKSKQISNSKLKSSEGMDKSLSGGGGGSLWSIGLSGLNSVNYSNGNSPYSWEKLYSEFPSPRAVQSGKCPTFSQRWGSLVISVDRRIITNYPVNRVQGLCLLLLLNTTAYL